MDRFELPADSHPVSLDCDECGSSIVYGDDVARCLEVHGHCPDCHRLHVDAEAFGLTVDELRAANARTDEEQAVWLASDRLQNPEYYSDLNWGRTDELLSADPEFQLVCDVRLAAAIEHREASNSVVLDGEAA